MKENKYDDPSFFGQYLKMNRSREGLQAAGEWYVLEEMLPEFRDKNILDLGCGLGWHCRYAIEKGATSATGIDISEKMLEKAKEINQLTGITYLRQAFEDVRFPAEQFDIVLCSLSLHYTASIEVLFQHICQWLRTGGYFVFSVEHPVFTASGKQEWIYGPDQEKLYWPVDHYFKEGKREALFLGAQVIKYHRTITTYINALLKAGFCIRELQEPQPSPEMLQETPEMKEEQRRPMMLLISAQK